MTSIVHGPPDPGGSDPGGDDCTKQLYHPPDQNKAAFNARRGKAQQLERVTRKKIHHPNSP